MGVSPLLFLQAESTTEVATAALPICFKKSLLSMILTIMMSYITFHINRAEWSGRAEALAGAAADAFVFVHSRHLYRSVWTFVVYHLDGSCRAMAGAVAAADAVGEHYAIVFNPYGMTHMDAGLFLTCDGLDGTSGTDLAATRTFRATIAALKRHRGLHKVHQVGGGTQDVVRT